MYVFFSSLEIRTPAFPKYTHPPKSVQIIGRSVTIFTYLINACTPMLVSSAEVDAIWDHCSWIILISVSVRVAILGNEREFSCQPNSFGPTKEVKVYWHWLAHVDDNIRTCCINYQYRSMLINAGSNLLHWHQCRSININNWSVLRSIDRYWSALIFIEIHFGSMQEIWFGIDQHWLLIQHVL